MIAEDTANRLLDVLRLEQLSVQIHVGPPADGTRNQAKEKRRLRLRFGSPQRGVMKANPVRWEDVAADEVWTHASLWNAERRFVADIKLDTAQPVRRGDAVDFDALTIRVADVVAAPSP